MWFALGFRERGRKVIGGGVEGGVSSWIMKSFFCYFNEFGLNFGNIKNEN